MSVAINLATAHREALALVRSASCLTSELIALGLRVSESELPALYADPDRLLPTQRVSLVSLLIPVADFTSDAQRARNVGRVLFDSLEQTALTWGITAQDERDLKQLRKLLFPSDGR
jgi:hypothetical protein